MCMPEISRPSMIRSKSRTAFLHYRRVLALRMFNCLSFPPHWKPGWMLKNKLLEAAGVRCGSNVQLSENFYMWDGRRVSIGEGARIGVNCQLYDFHQITIGRRALVSHNFTVVAGTHNIATLEDIAGPVAIGDDVWIGVGVTIVGPAAIGDRCVVGAGSVVMRSLPEHCVCAGTPCKVIRTR